MNAHWMFFVFLSLNLHFLYYRVGGNPWKTSVAIVKPPKTTAAPRLNRILKALRSLNAWTVPITAKIAMSPKMTINKFIGKTLLSIGTSVKIAHDL